MTTTTILGLPLQMFFSMTIARLSLCRVVAEPRRERA